MRLNYRPGTKRLCDADGLHPTLSCALDALTAHGIIPDDNYLYVSEASAKIWPPLRGIPAAFWLDIEPIISEEVA